MEKRSITPIEGSHFFLPADLVIVAAGQRAETFKYPIKRPGAKDHEVILSADPDENQRRYRTTAQGLYMAGDCLTGPSTVIEAIGMGRRAAEKILQDLTGKPFRKRVVRMEEAATTDASVSGIFCPVRKCPSSNPSGTGLPEGTGKWKPAVPENAAEESRRCYLCYLHYEIDLDRCIYCRYCMDVAPRDCIKLVDAVKINDVGAVVGFEETTDWGRVNAVMIDNSRCIRCGECLRVCPVDCISVTRVELTERSVTEAETHA